MELVAVFRFLFLGALAASLGVYAWRAYRHVVHHETRHDRAERRRAEASSADGATASPSTTPTPRRGGQGSTTDRSTRSTTEPPVASGPPAAAPPVKPVSFVKGVFATPSVPNETIEDGSLVREVIRQELAKKQGLAAPASAPDEAASAGAGRSGMFAKPRRTVAELVAGIELPCDLAPLVIGDTLDPNRALFTTSGHAPTTVAAALADELERLGFRIDTVGDNEAVARKPDGDLRIVIHDDVSAFPQAPRDGVVVELST